MPTCVCNFAEKLTGLDTKGFLESILYTFGGMFIVIILMLFLLYIRFVFKKTENLQTLWLRLPVDFK